ncbi:MAG: AGE family epimerase/isomerase [Hyphomonadaceae bacterium]
MKVMPNLKTRSAIRAWLFDKALPLWAEHGFDQKNGGVVEQMTFAGRDAGLDFKRSRVAGRQAYVFSHAHMLGWSSGNAQAGHAIAWLTDRTWLGPEKGFARTLSREGAVKDTTPDLYDYAFILFGFAWRHRMMKDSASRDWLHRTLDFVETTLRHPGGEGFWNEVPNKGWRQQNPHMHLTEACLAAYQATGEERFADAVRELVSLFQTRLFDRPTGTLAEYFTDDWNRAPGDDGRLVEPGHLMEWAWILNEARKLVGLDTADDIRAALRFAEGYGVDPEDGATFNGLRDDGAVITRASRSWPNAERIKGAVALYELDGVDPAPVIDTAASLLLSRYLALEPAGIWIDQFDEQKRPISPTVPASTLYHLFLAFAEALRISA